MATQALAVLSLLAAGLSLVVAIASVIATYKSPVHALRDQAIIAREQGWKRVLRPSRSKTER